MRYPEASASGAGLRRRRGRSDCGGVHLASGIPAVRAV